MDPATHHCTAFAQAAQGLRHQISHGCKNNGAVQHIRQGLVRTSRPSCTQLVCKLLCIQIARSRECIEIAAPVNDHLGENMCSRAKTEYADFPVLPA